MTEPWIEVLAVALDAVQPDGTPGSFAEAIERDGVPALRAAGFEMPRKVCPLHGLPVRPPPARNCSGCRAEIDRTIAKALGPRYRIWRWLRDH